MSLRTSFHKRRQEGFTIIETLIVLAVTGSLFLMVAGAISGRQNQTEFQQAAGSLETRVQQIIEQIANGYYATTQNASGNQDFSCTSDGTTPLISTAQSIRGENGGNSPGDEGCVFLGSMLQFTTANPESFYEYTVVGAKNSSTTIKGTNPILLARGINPPFNGNNIPNDQFSTLPLEFGLQFKWMHYFLTPSDTPHDTAAIGFLSDLSSQQSASTGTSQNIDFVVVPNSGTLSFSSDSPNGVDAIDNYLRGSSVITQLDRVEACFDSGGTNQHALLTIGGDAQLTSTTMHIGDGSCG